MTHVNHLEMAPGSSQELSIIVSNYYCLVVVISISSKVGPSQLTSVMNQELRTNFTKSQVKEQGKL